MFDSVRILTARLLISSKFPIGVAIMYKPLLKVLFFSILLLIISSCTPQSITQKEILSNKDETQDSQTLEIIVNNEKKESQVVAPINLPDIEISREVEILLPKNKNQTITKNFINSLELSLYKKKNSEISLSINFYSDDEDLQNIISSKTGPGKIFIGPLTSDDSKEINKWCKDNVLFFSFASDRSLARDCIYLINFFPEDELEALFNFFGKNKKIALLFPENDYGIYISKIIDEIANNSNSVLVSKVSYKEDLSNARVSIKKLSKYELRKKELKRQKNILKNKDDEVSKKALKKIEKFETIGELDFSHIIIADYNIRLLQIAPLLPFYDVDPNRIKFVGTGVWDDEVFFYEPSLQGGIFPGIPKNKRNFFIKDYSATYKELPIRTSTIIYDLIGLLSYFYENNFQINEVKNLLNASQTKFDGIDGKFVFKNNLIKRELSILEISNGKTELIK